MSGFWTLKIFDCVDSTQTLVKEAGASGQSEGFAVQALTQNAGQGRHGRTWISQRGNLFLSLLLRPECAPARMGELSILTGVAAAQTLLGAVEGRTGVRLKWPNDVYFDNRKCAGILIESEIGKKGLIDWLAVGVGVNIENAPQQAFSALRSYSDITCDNFRDNLLTELQTLYGEWKTNGFDNIRRLWLSHSYPEGTGMSVKVANVTISGYFAGLEPDGSLILQASDGARRVITAGDVFIEPAQKIGL